MPQACASCHPLEQSCPRFLPACLPLPLPPCTMLHSSSVSTRSVRSKSCRVRNPQTARADSATANKVVPLPQGQRLHRRAFEEGRSGTSSAGRGRGGEQPGRIKETRLKCYCRRGACILDNGMQGWNCCGCVAPGGMPSMPGMPAFYPATPARMPGGIMSIVACGGSACSVCHLFAQVTELRQTPKT